MADLRVLVIDPGQDLGGAQMDVLRLSGLLRDRGVEQILAAPEHSDLAKAWRAGGGEYVSFETPSDRSIRGASGGLHSTRHSAEALRELGRTMSSARVIARLARQAGAEVLHANGYWTHLEVATASRLSRRPAVLHLHERSHHDALGPLRAVGVLTASATVAVSQAVAGSLPTWARRRLQIVHSGIDTLRFRPGPGNAVRRAQLTQGDPTAAVVLVLARLIPSKGVDHVVRAVAGLPRRLANTHLVIAGSAPDPAYAQSLREQGEALLGDRVHWLGARDDVDELLRTSDVAVLASESEALPLSVLEAQACAVPVVAYPAGGGAEIIEHGVTGLLAEQGNVADLSQQLDRMLNDRALAQRVAEQALRYVLIHHSLTEQADKNVNILRSLVAGRNRRTR